MERSKTLVVLDYDQTVIEDIANYKARDIIPPPLSDEIENLYSSRGWTNYMNAIFETLNNIGVTAAEIKKKVKTIPLVDGMQKLFDYFRSHEEMYELIVISDSNTLFIDWSLQYHQLKVGTVYSNPAVVGENGEIKLSPFHQQDYCNESTYNLCKGTNLL